MTRATAPGHRRRCEVRQRSAQYRGAVGLPWRVRRCVGAKTPSLAPTRKAGRSAARSRTEIERRWGTQSELLHQAEDTRGHPALRDGLFDPVPSLARQLLLVRSDRACFVVVDVEYRIELGELEQVVDLLGQLEELERCALILGRSESSDQLAKA